MRSVTEVERRKDESFGFLTRLVRYGICTAIFTVLMCCQYDLFADDYGRAQWYVISFLVSLFLPWLATVGVVVGLLVL